MGSCCYSLAEQGQGPGAQCLQENSPGGVLCLSLSLFSVAVIPTCGKDIIGNYEDSGGAEGPGLMERQAQLQEGPGDKRKKIELQVRESASFFPTATRGKKLRDSV